MRCHHGNDPASCADPCCSAGYRAGLMKAARMASARAGKFRHEGPGETGEDGLCVLELICEKCTFLCLAGDLRKLAKEES